MKTFIFREIGINCDVEIHGETIREVLEKIKDHAQKNHREEWERFLAQASEEEIKEEIVHHIEDDFSSPV